MWEHKHPPLARETPFAWVEGVCACHSHKWSCAHARASATHTPPPLPCAGPGNQAIKVGDRWFRGIMSSISQSLVMGLSVSYSFQVLFPPPLFCSGWMEWKSLSMKEDTSLLKWRSVKSCIGAPKSPAASPLQSIILWHRTHCLQEQFSIWTMSPCKCNSCFSVLAIIRHVDFLPELPS